MGLFSKKIKINYQLKNQIDEMLSSAKTVSPNLAETMRNDLILFLLKQVAADGQVAKEEVQFINGYLDMCWTVDKMINYLNQYFNVIKDYVLPKSILMFTEVYLSIDKEEETELSRNLKELTIARMDVFLLSLVLLCKEIISIDGDISDEELDGLNKIITTSSDYIESKLGFVSKGVEVARRAITN